MTPVYQTKQYPAGNCFAACVASVLDKKIEDVDVDVASCGDSWPTLIARVEQKANCRIYWVPYETLFNKIVKTSERYCLVEVCSFVLGSPDNKGSIWHVVVCEISQEGELSLAFNPDKGDQRTQLQHFPDFRRVFFVMPNDML
jgi:hypothetical protein